MSERIRWQALHYDGRDRNPRLWSCWYWHYQLCSHIRYVNLSYWWLYVLYACRFCLNMDWKCLLKMYALCPHSYKRQCASIQVSFTVEMSCMLHHPFTVVVVGPSGCGKTKWVLRLVDSAREIMTPPPDRIWCCHGEYQRIFNDYHDVNFHEGLPDLTHEVFDGRCPTLLIIDDLMSETCLLYTSDAADE